MRAFEEAFNVKIMPTSAEGSWSNGACERLNAVGGNTVRKIITDSSSDFEVALAWVVSARNAFTNCAGFSLNKFVFGHNPWLINVCANELSGLCTISTSEFARNNLSVLRLARHYI